MPRFRVATFLVLGLLVGCKTSSFCDYSISQHGWVPELAPPNDVVAASAGWKGARFFRNVSGEILVCPNRRPTDNCGSVYKVYEATGDTYTLKGTIVCMT